MKRLFFVFTVFCLQGLPLFGQSSKDTLQFMVSEKTEIDHTLREIVQHCNQTKQNGSKIPADEIEIDLARLAVLLGNMDVSLKDLPCDTAVPLQPDTQQAMNALRSLLKQGGDEQRRKAISELKERIVFVKKIHDLSVTLYKLTLISAMTEALIKIVPVSMAQELFDIVADDILNLGQPGEVKNWGKKDEYKKYWWNNQYEIEARLLEKARLVNGINKKGELEMKPTELKRIIHEIVMQKTTEDVKYFEEEIKKLESEISQLGTEDQQNNAYFLGLISKLEQTLKQSVWINNPRSFEKSKASINIVAVDSATGSAILQATASLDPTSGSAQIVSGGITFQGISEGSYVAKVQNAGYIGGQQSVNVTECKQYNLVFRLQREASPTPSPALPPVLKENVVTEETPDVDEMFELEGEPPVTKTFKAWLTCGSSLEIVTGEIDRSCGVVVSGWRGNTTDRVEVNFVQLPGQIAIFPDRASQAPSNMFTAGVTDLHDQYEFPFQFSARSTAQRGSIPVEIVVRQNGVDDVRLTLTVNVLAKGQIAVPGAGNAPAAIQGSGGNYCVWRHKLLSDVDPDCWHFVASTCDNSRYRNPNNGHILAGSGMSQAEADALITEQSVFFSDACKNTNAPSDDTSAQQNNLIAQLQTGKNLYEQCQYQEAINVMNGIIGSGFATNDAKDYIGRSQQAIAGMTRIESILQEASQHRSSCNFKAGLTLLEQINAIDPPSKECKGQYLTRANALKNELNDLQSEINLSQVIISEAESHLSACRFKEAAKAADSVITSNIQCEESGLKKANEIKAKAESMMQIEDDIDAEKVIAEMAVAKNLKDKKAVIQKSMQNIRNLVMTSGNPACFQQYLEVVKIFDNALAPNPLEKLGLDNYGSGDNSENNADGWGTATADATNREPELVDETPQEPEAVVAEENGTPENTTKVQNTLTNLLQNITKAVIDSQNPDNSADPFTNERDNTTDQNSDTADQFVGKWQSNVSLISYNGPRDDEGNEVCEFDGPRSETRELTITHNNYGYGLHDGGNAQQYYARSEGAGLTEHTNLHRVWVTTRDVSGNSIRFADTQTFNRETITTTIELEVNGDHISGTMKLVTSSGCDYNFSISGAR